MPSNQSTQADALRIVVADDNRDSANMMAMLLGEQRFYDYARAFGFGQRTGFPFGGEVRGQMASPKNWDGLTITRMPMGHSVAATPLQMHMAMSAVDLSERSSSCSAVVMSRLPVDPTG